MRFLLNLLRHSEKRSVAVCVLYSIGMECVLYGRTVSYGLCGVGPEYVRTSEGPIRDEMRLGGLQYEALRVRSEHLRCVVNTTCICDLKRHVVCVSETDTDGERHGERV